MRRVVVVSAVLATLGGCKDPPKWLGGGWGRREPPVSLPKTAEPATRPAKATTAPAPSTRPAPSKPAVAKPLGAGAVAAKPTPAGTAAPKPRPTPKPTPTPAPVPAPGTRAATGAAAVYVNERPIHLAEFTRLLIAGHGLVLAQQLIANELVAQEAARQKVTLDANDVQAEHDRTLDSMFGKISDVNQRQRLLSQLLDRNHVSPPQWDLTMRRNALLAKLAAKRVVVTEADLQDEFGRRYERKVEVQHVQTASLADAQKVLRELASGADFTAMVHKYSMGPSVKEAGLLAPFGLKDTGTPPALREAGLALRKIGEVSDPIQIGTAFHIVKLLRIIEPKDVKFEAVKGALRVNVVERKTRAIQQDILQILIRSARIRYVEPTLKAQADKGDGQ